MIRRLLIAAVLCAAGLLVLHLTIGVENFLPGVGARSSEPIRQRQDDRPGGPGIVVGGTEGSDAGSALSVSGRGPVEFRRDTEFELADGTVLYVPRWIVTAEDSETVEDDLVQLFDVDATFHRARTDSDSTGPGRDEPSAERAGHVQAREALVEVGRNAEGLPSIREDREMDLFDVHLVATPSAASGIGELRFDVARLLVLHAGDRLNFHTPTSFETFRGELAGEPPAAITGRGLEGHVPAESNDDRPLGAVAAGAVDQLRVDIAAEPQLDYAATTLRSRGPLRYREHEPSGRGRLTLRDAVAFRGADLLPDGAVLTARAELLDATLLRNRSDDQEPLPLELRLRGDPVEVDAAGVELTCRTLEAASAGARGEPWFVSARGDPVLQDAERDLSARASAALHLAAPRVLLDRLLGAHFGHAGLPWPALAGHLVSLQGESTLRDGTRELELSASEGIRALGDAQRDDRLLLARGRGAVTVRHAELTATGSAGFLLGRDGDELTLRLGPRRLDPEHAWSLHGSTPRGDELHFAGHGACTLRRDAGGALDIELHSPADDIVLRSATATLSRIGVLTARLDAEGRIEFVEGRHLAAPAGRCAVAFEHDGERLTGTAERVELRDGRLRLAGLGGSELRRGTERITGGRIDVHAFGTDDATIDARTFADGRPARLVVLEPVAADASAPRHELELSAGRIRALPGVAAALTTRWHGVPPLAARAITADRLLADGDVVIVRRNLDTGVEVAVARGDRLVGGLDDLAGVLFGDPARADVRDSEQGARLIGRAPTLRLRFDPARDSADLELLPGGRELARIDVRRLEDASAAAGSGPPREFRLLCDGTIESTPEGLRFGGPVQLRELAADGTVDPGGIALAADAVELDWDIETRSLRRATARDGADFRSGRIHATADFVSVDFSAETCELTAVDHHVVIEIGGRRLRGTAFVLDYRRQRIDAWHVRGGTADGPP